MKYLKFVFLVLLVASCNAPKAVYDYDQAVNFQNYSTYQIFPDLRSGLSQLDERRLLNSLERSLRSEGLARTGSPDLYINVYTEKFEERSRNNLGVGVGGTGRNVGVGVSGGIPLGGPETFLRLTFDFIDVNTDSLVWQAIVTSKFDPNARPEERQEKFDQIVEKALKGYPPKR